MLQFLIESTISLINTENNAGPKTLLCGMPDITAAGFDLHPFTITSWKRLERNDEIHLLINRGFTLHSSTSF